MPSFLQNTVNIRDAIMLGALLVTVSLNYATTKQQVQSIKDDVAHIEKDFDKRADQAEKALDLLHLIDKKLDSHVAGHRNQ